MRVAAIYDIHADLPALEAVLHEVREAGVDRIVIGGDVVPGPMPLETVSRLQELQGPVHFITGNGEREVLARMGGGENAALPQQAREAIDWTAQQLGDDDKNWFANWPATLSLQIPGIGNVLFCHATPRNDNEIFTRLTEEEILLPVFKGVEASVVVCGHTHMQFDRTVGTHRVVNAGSVGMPFGEPGAYWLLIGPDIELRCTQYDLTEAAERIRQTKYPQAEDFANRNILRPPSEQQILEAFRRAELK